MENTKLMTLEEVAEYLQLSMHQIYVMARRNELPTIRVSGARLRVNIKDLEEWLESKKTK